MACDEGIVLGVRVALIIRNVAIHDRPMAEANE
jgi:hypothetical protein